MKKSYKQVLTVAVLSATMAGSAFAANEVAPAQSAPAAPAATQALSPNPVANALARASWPNESAKVSATGLTGFINPDAEAIANVEGVKVNAPDTFTAQSVPAQYVSGLTADKLAPLVGKRITSVTVANVPADMKEKVMSLLSTKVGDKVTESGIDADIQALGNLGVFAVVTPVFKVVPEGVAITYDLTVNPIVRGVVVDGNTIYPQKELLQFLHIPVGQVLNTVEVGQRAQGIDAALQRDGYMLAHITGVRVDQEGIVHLDLQEGIVQDIIVKGNDKTKTYVVTREMLQKVGQPLNKFLARRSLQRIYNLGYFEDVNMKLLPGADPNKVVLEIDVVEQKTGVITVGAGYSKSNGFNGLFEVGENNFRGTGDKINLHWEFGGKGAGGNYSLSYTRPWLDDKATSLSATLFNRKSAYTDYQGDGQSFASYERKSQGLSVGLGRQTGIFSREYLTLETRKDMWMPPTKDNYGNYSGYGAAYGRAPEYLKKNFGRTNSIQFQRIFDSRDNVYDPTSGKYIAYGVQLAGHILGGDFDFLKGTGEFRTYYDMGHHHVIAFRVSGGVIKGDAPYSQLFAIGGSNTLRGYEDDQFRGQKYYNSTIEYRLPLFKKVSGVAFVDVGGAWDTPSVPWYIGGKKFNMGYGAGLRVQTPIGPVRLDYAIGRKGGKFTFAFGGQF